jgi:hypothetical protein
VNDLAALQRAFQDGLLGAGAGAGAGALDRLRSTSKADAATLFAVYRDAYMLRLIEALTDDHPALLKQLGQEEFAALARADAAEHPSRHPSIRWFGAKLPAFLREAPPWAERPWLAELAAFERALRDAFDAADAAPIGVEAMAAVAPADWPGLRLRFLPSLRRLDLAWSAARTWKDGSPPERLEAPVSWAVWRPALVTEYRSLDPDEAGALDAAAAGGTFAELCEGLLRWHPPEQAAARAAGLLRAWLDQRLLAAVAA